jgi:hypothetical protein
VIDRARLAEVIFGYVSDGEMLYGEHDALAIADRVLALVGPEMERRDQELALSDTERDRLRKQLEAARLAGISARSVIAGLQHDVAYLRERVRLLREALEHHSPGGAECVGRCAMCAALAETEAP